MVELLRIEPKTKEDTDTKEIARAAAESYRSFLKSRAVFAPVGDLGHRGDSGRSHSFKNRRFSEGKVPVSLSTDIRQEHRPRRSHSSDNILEEVNRQQAETVHDTFGVQSATNVKRSKFEYIKQLFSKKPDKPKKYSAPSSPAPRSVYTFHRPSDATSNYSTSDYASDQELDDTTAPFAKIRLPVHLNRNSKIANIVKRFEPNSPIHTDNSKQLIDNPSTSEVIDRTHSQTLIDIQAISSDLSSLMTNINYFSSDKSAVNNTSYPHKQLVVETILEPQINEVDKHTPKVTTSYSTEVKKQFDLTLDSCHSSEHGDDVLSLDDFLSHTRYARDSQEDELDSDTNTEKGSTDEVNRAVVDMTSSTDMEMTMESTLDEFEIQTEITMDTSINPEVHKGDSILHQIQLDRPAYIDLMNSDLHDRMTRIMQNVGTDSTDRSVHLPSLLPTQTIPAVNLNTMNIIPTNESNVNTEMTSPTEQDKIPAIQNINFTYPTDNYEANTVKTSPIVTSETVNPFMTSPTECTENPTINSYTQSAVMSPVNLIQNTVPVESPPLQHRHAFSLSSDDVTNTLSDLPDTPRPATDSDACSVHSVPGYAFRPHKYTGYSLPPGETRSVSERIRSLLCKEPIDCPKVDKLSLIRAAIERKKSEAKPAYLPDRPVLLEIKEPEEFSVRSLRDRFEVKMKQIEPSGVLLTPSQITKPARNKSEDLGIKPTFAGVTRKLSSSDILAMQSEYNTDRDANRNKSLVQPKYTIK